MKIYKRYKNPISCVYTITCNNYCYVGSAKIFSKRKFEHLWNLRNHKHSNPILQNLFNKYGEDNFIFSIKEICDPKLLIIREQYWMDNIPNEINKINIAEVAGSTTGIKHTDISIEKRRNSMIGGLRGTAKKNTLTDGALLHRW
jgi:group I intron endonuclease